MVDLCKKKIGRRMVNVRCTQDTEFCWMCGKRKPCNHYGLGGRPDVSANDAYVPLSMSDRLLNTSLMAGRGSI
jgi:hypothetical protein